MNALGGQLTLSEGGSISSILDNKQPNLSIFLIDMVSGDGLQILG